MKRSPDHWPIVVQKSCDFRFLLFLLNKGNNKITELRTILQRESQNSYVYKQTKSVNIFARQSVNGRATVADKV
jgi:hypothetical protein